MTVLYLFLAVIIHLIIEDTLVVTLISDIIITVIGLFLLNKFTTKSETKTNHSVGLYLVVVLPLLLLVWFTCQLTSTTLYNIVGDANFDTYTDIAGSNIALYAFIALFVAPTTEEVLMRGFWFNWLKKRNMTLLGYILSPVIFAALHGTLVHYPTGILFGLFLCFIYELSDSIIPVIILHFGFNLFAVFLGGLKVPDMMLTVPFVGTLYIAVTAMIIFLIVYAKKQSIGRMKDE
jgi:membrane protease YdiL (CAAX protease family)